MSATFAQLTDDQRWVVVQQLGYLPIYSFSYSNPLRHQTVNGNTTVITWSPLWANDPPVIQRFNAPGLDQMYIRMPQQAADDFLRVVSQGSQAINSELVGRFRDEAQVFRHSRRPTPV
jgi:hypothetical protein